jgi:hypothetical protein
VQVRPTKGEGSLYFYRSGEKREEFCVVVSPGKKKRKDKWGDGLAWEEGKRRRGFVLFPREEGETGGSSWFFFFFWRGFTLELANRRINKGRVRWHWRPNWKA